MQITLELVPTLEMNNPRALAKNQVLEQQLGQAALRLVIERAG